jgi:hypothetical protein
MIFKVRTIPFTSNSVEARDLNAVPAKAPNGRPWEIRAIMLKISISELAAAASDAIAAQDWCAIIQSLEFRDNTGRPFLTDNPLLGRFVREMKRYIARRAPTDPALVAANSNTTNLRQLVLTLPLRLDFLADPDDHLKLATQLRNGEIRLGWCTGTLSASPFGTGHTINAATQCDILLDLVPCRNLKARPSLLYGTKVPDTFDRCKLPVIGKTLIMNVFRPENLLTGIATTDFVDVELRGNELDVNRQSVDNTVHEFNENYLRDSAAALIAPTVGPAATVPSVPLYCAPNGASLAEIPSETEPTVTLTGNPLPAVTTVRFGYLISKPVDLDHFSNVVEASPDLPISREGVRAGIAAARAAVAGKNGRGVHSEDPVRGWVPHPIDVSAAKAGS